MPLRHISLRRRIAGAFMALLLPTMAQASELVVYTAAPEADLAKIETAFVAAHPGAAIRWVRDSTARITARLIDEAAAPQADVVWGMPATRLAMLAARNLFMPYAPPQMDALDAGLIDRDRPPHWLGLRAWVSAVCFNPAAGAARGLAAPASWQDLLQPAYAGSILMPHPATTATGYMIVANWIVQMGEPAAWQFMDALHGNIAVYTESGTRPCSIATQGDYPVGLSHAFLAARMQAKDEPVETVLPGGLLGWDVEGVAILRDTPRPDAAKTFVDWSLGEQADRMYRHEFAVTVRPNGGAPLKHLPADLRQRMAPNDFRWLAQNRDRILEEWRRRYDEKAEPQTKPQDETLDRPQPAAAP